MALEEKVVSEVANSRVAETVAKQLWPSMLFLVVMSLIALVGAKWLGSSLDPIHHVVSYWMWFMAMLTITGFGIYVFFLDAKIQLEKNTST